MSLPMNPWVSFSFQQPRKKIQISDSKRKDLINATTEISEYLEPQPLL